MAEKTRVGVVGVGYLGSSHAKIYAQMPEVELVGVVDTDARRVQEVAQSYACRAFSAAGDLLGQVDAVSIVVPTVYHLSTAAPFLEHGVHIMMEKPLAPDYPESLALVEMAEKSAVVFQVGHLERFNAGVMALASRVKNPRFIEAHRLSPFVDRATDVDVVTDLMIHDIDIILSLAGSTLVHIAASGTPVITDKIDIANARLAFANGAVANVTASRVSNKRHRYMRIFEQQHYYKLNYIDQQIEVATASPPAGGQQWPTISTEQMVIEPRQPLNEELGAFIHSVRTQAPPLVTGRIGLEAVRVAHTVKETIQS